MSLGLDLGFGVNRGGASNNRFNQHALTFNGTDEYLTRALPTNLLTGTVNDWSSPGSKPSGWQAGVGAVWDSTEAGRTGTYAVGCASTGISIPSFTVGQKYKVKIRYKSTATVNFASTTLIIASTWNTAYVTFVATTTALAINSSASFFLDVLNFTPDWKLDLNEQYELIKHSDNRDFADTSVTYTTNGNQAFSSGSGVGLITSTGVGDATTNYVGLPNTDIETLEVGKKYTLEASLKTDPASLSYGSDLFSSIQHSATHLYETFTASANDITSAINTTGFASAFINIGNVTAGQIVKVTFNLTLNSGAAPRVLLMQSGELLAGTNADQQIPVAGANTLYFTVIGAQSPTYLVIREPATTATDFSMAGIVVVKSTPITHTFKIGTKTVTITPSITATYSKSVLNFLWETTDRDSLQGQELRQYLSGTGNCNFDNVSLTQAYDLAIQIPKKSLSYANNDWILGTGAGDTSYVGYDIYINTAGNVVLVIRQSATSAPNLATTNGTTANDWTDVTIIFNRTADSTIRFRGANKTGSLTSLGKIILNRFLAIGTFSAGGADSFNGLLGSVQLIRFTKIEDSNFTIATYKIGQSVSGGGMEEVLHIDPRLGSSVAEMLQDYSGNGNQMTAVNIDTTNRIRTTT